jgi:hypothetical protein
MSNPSGPDHDDATNPVVPIDHEQPTQETDAATEAIGAADAEPERRYTAPGFDAGSTQIIDRTPDPETEIFSAPTEVFAVSGPPRTGPQAIPARPVATRRRSWALVLAVIAVIAALAAVAVLATFLLTRDDSPKATQEDMVRSTIQSFDAAVQNGDLAALRGITCGQTRDSYVKYDDQAWSDTHARVAAARQYPVWPASTRWSSTVTMPRPMSPRSWPSIRPPGPPAVSTCSSGTTSGRSARRPE